MSPVSLSITSICFVLLVSAVSPQPSYLLSQQRNEVASISLLEPTASGPVEYELVPSGDYAVTTVDSELSLLDIVLSPITAVMSLGSTALSIVTWVIVKGGLILLGMGIVIAFCALTPYCTLTIEKPAFLARENIDTFPYLDQLEDFVSIAYHKYLEMQK